MHAGRGNSVDSSDGGSTPNSVKEVASTALPLPLFSERRNASSMTLGEGTNEEELKSRRDRTEPTGCRFHPERPAVVRCNKYEYHYCRECVEACDACTDPNLFCQHRTQCFIWEVCRGEIKRRRRDAACAGPPSGNVEPATDSAAHSGPESSH